VLVGHSYGGAVITNAGAGQPNVTGLVYASAFAPDLGEVLGQFPPGPGTANLYPVTYPNNFGTFLFLNQQKFRESFAQDVDPLQASIMATVQKPGNVVHFTDPTTAVAWKTLPSWYLISTLDRMIPPSLQQKFASRMHEGHNHLGPLKPCVDRLPSSPVVRADPGSSEGWREQVGSLRCASLRCKQRAERSVNRIIQWLLHNLAAHKCGIP